LSPNAFFNIFTAMFMLMSSLHPGPYRYRSRGGIVFIICRPYRAIGCRRNFILSLAFVVTVSLSWTVVYSCDLTDHRSSLIFSSSSLFKWRRCYVSTIPTFRRALRLLWSLVRINHSWTFVDRS